MYHFFLGTRVTAFPTKLFGVHLNHFLPCFSETTVSLYPVTLALPAVVALLGLPLGALAVKLTGTGATSLVDGCVSQGGAVLSPLALLLMAKLEVKWQLCLVDILQKYLVVQIKHYLVILLP